MTTKTSKICFESICAVMCLVFLLLLMCSGCAGVGSWLDKNVGNNDGKYDGPTVTITKTLSNGMPVMLTLDETGAVNVDVQLVDADGNVYDFVQDGKVKFEHDGVTYEVDLIREAPQG